MESKQTPLRGFAVGTNAADAARKNIELGTAHRFTPATASAAGRKGAAQRWGKDTAPCSSQSSSRISYE